MQDPETLITILKILMLAVMVGAGIAIFGEIVPMARGVTPSKARDDAHDQ
jgi:hypothetical protein